MNSQRKQQGKAGIKTDRYGIPLNYGNYKNGRLVNSKGKKGGKGGGGGDRMAAGRSSSANRSGRC